MTMAERYIRATRSSHLKIEPEPGDVDVVISAGLSDNLGTVLLRCRQEWDSQRAEFERMQRTVLRNRADAEAIRRRKAETDEELEQRDSEAGRAFDEAEMTLSTSRALAMMSMGSLPLAFVALQRRALDRVIRRGLEVDVIVVADIVHTALDVWLDQRCNTCAGTKETGIYGGPRAICNKCKGTGIRRRVFPSKTSAEYALGEWVISEMELKASDAQRHLVRNGRAVDKAKRWIDEHR